jgi:hypothetical protein
MRFREALEPGAKVKIRNAYSRMSRKGMVTRIFTGPENSIPKVEYRSLYNSGLYVCNLDQVSSDMGKRTRKSKSKRHEVEEEN